MTLFHTELKVFTTFSWRTTQLGWRSTVHLMPWITISQPPLVAAPNWCGEKCVTKASQNWRHKTRLVSRYNVSPTTMGWTLLEGLVMVKKWVVPRTYVIWGGMWPCAIWEQSWNTKGISSLNFQGENSFESVQKPL
jgi:hypothetical protein